MLGAMHLAAEGRRTHPQRKERTYRRHARFPVSPRVNKARMGSATAAAAAATDQGYSVQTPLRPPHSLPPLQQDPSLPPCLRPFRPTPAGMPTPRSTPPPPVGITPFPSPIPPPQDPPLHTEKMPHADYSTAAFVSPGTVHFGWPQNSRRGRLRTARPPARPPAGWLQLLEARATRVHPCGGWPGWS